MYYWTPLEFLLMRVILYRFDPKVRSWRVKLPDTLGRSEDIFLRSRIALEDSSLWMCLKNNGSFQYQQWAYIGRGLTLPVARHDLDRLVNESYCIVDLNESVKYCIMSIMFENPRLARSNLFHPSHGHIQP
jgi:hypothetical protein